MLLTNSEKKEKRIEFTVLSSNEEFENAVIKTYNAEKGRINIPGFRKGKAPLSIVEGMFGPDVFWQGALDELIQSAFEAGIEQGEIKMIGMPAVTNADVTEDRCATYTFSVEAYPEVELGEYKGLEVTKPNTELTEDELNAELENIRKQNARLVSVDDRAAQMGDTCNINFEGFLDAEKTNPFDGGKGENYDLELGSNSFVPGFEDQIVGMTIGEEKDLNITFPEDYVEDLAGKDVVFAVKLNEIKFSELPELDDEFAMDVSEFDTLEEYKESLRKELAEKKAEQGKSSIRSEAVTKAIENMKAEVPETMINSHLDAIIRNFAANYGLSDPDVPTEKLAAMLGMDEETINTSIRPSAEFEAKQELLLNAIIEKENIEATEEALNEYVNKVCGTIGATADDLKNYFGMDYIVSEYKKETALNIIADSAVPVEEKKAPKKRAPRKKKAEAVTAEAEAVTAEAEAETAEAAEVKAEE